MIGHVARLARGEEDGSRRRGAREREQDTNNNSDKSYMNN